MKINKVLFCVLLSFVFRPLILQAWPSNEYTLTDIANIHNLQKHTDVILANANDIPISDIITGMYDSLFVPLQSINKENIPANCWSRVQLVLPDSVSNNWILETGNVRNDLVEIFVVDSAGYYDAKTTGYYTYATDDIEYEVDYNKIKLDLPRHRESGNTENSVTIYLKYNSLVYNKPDINIQLLQPRFFYEKNGKEEIKSKFLLGIIIGSVFAMFLICLINYFFTQDKSFLYVSMAVVSLTIYIIYCSGGFHLFFKYGRFDYFIIEILSMFMFGCYGFFVRYYVINAKIHKIWIVIINSSIGLCFVNFCVACFSFLLYDNTLSYITFDWIVGTIQILSFLVITIRLLFSKNEFAFLITIGNASASLIIMVYFLSFLIFNVDFIALLITMLSLNTIFFIVAFIYRLWNIKNRKQYFQIAQLDKLETELSLKIIENNKLKRKLQSYEN